MNVCYQIVAVYVSLTFAEATSPPNNHFTNSPPPQALNDDLDLFHLTFWLFYISNICFRVTLTMVCLQKAQFLPEQQSGVLEKSMIPAFLKAATWVQCCKG